MKMNIKNPIISIVTPYYNAQDYIEETAKSVLSQTFPYFEWIIVDDGSSKEGKNKLKDIEKIDSRIKVFMTLDRQEPRLGRGEPTPNARSCTSKRFWDKKFSKKLKIYSVSRCG